MKTAPERIQEVIELYFKAWQTQDPDLLAKIFVKDAIYKVKPFGIEEHKGLKAIQDYWRENPVNKQTSPKPRIIAQALGEDMCFVEWETTFSTPIQAQKTVRGMLLLEFEDGMVRELREHYLSKEE